MRSKYNDNFKINLTQAEKFIGLFCIIIQIKSYTSLISSSPNLSPRKLRRKNHWPLAKIVFSDVKTTLRYIFQFLPATCNVCHPAIPETFAHNSISRSQIFDSTRRVNRVGLKIESICAETNSPTDRIKMIFFCILFAFGKLVRPWKQFSKYHCRVALAGRAYNWKTERRSLRASEGTIVCIRICHCDIFFIRLSNNVDFFTVFSMISLVLMVSFLIFQSIF